VPPAITAGAIARQPGARPWLFPDFDHDCCWEKVWPTVLAELGREIAPGTP
jgi:hypothetical protein